MRSEGPSPDLNSAHKLHLLSAAEHADKMLGDVEAVLYASKSKSAFPKFKDPLSPAQVKVVEDYLARIRAQMVRVVEGQGIPVPEPKFESIRSIRVALVFFRIAFQECTPDRMRGYGEVPESKLRELGGLVEEMVNAIDKLDSYLAQGLGQNLEARLERLGCAGADIDLVRTLERIIHAHGFVEFRSTLSMIIDRLETKSFEIALFGRVSSGKSSLLNHIVQSEVLPVGVNPITAVPTRIVYGGTPRLMVWYADRNPEILALEKLPEFVSERYNPANDKHVTRIVVELPSPRLRDGVVLVDTPGLGSLATAGAAETLAYLPRCDLGVVLIDAGSTLTEDDLSTIRTLYDAGIPASVLLSKSDLLAPEDRRQSLSYISEQIRSQLGLNLAIHPVSVQASQAPLLEAWLQDVILPLYDHHQELALESLRRKIGSLRESVETALKARLGRARSPEAAGDIGEVNRELRKAVGRIAEIRDRCLATTQDIRDSGESALAEAAVHLTESWGREDTTPSNTITHDSLVRGAAGMASVIFRDLQELARDLSQTLHRTGEALGFSEVPAEDDFVSAIKEMPRLDLGTLELHLQAGLLLKVSKKLAIRQTAQGLRKQIGPDVAEAFLTFGRMLDSWARVTLNELQSRFETHADGYRAHLDRIASRGQVSPSEEQALIHNLALLVTSGSSAKEEMTPAS
jgi:GTP-binding protein EngB required for normal cell division